MFVPCLSVGITLSFTGEAAPNYPPPLAVIGLLFLDIEGTLDLVPNIPKTLWLNLA